MGSSRWLDPLDPVFRVSTSFIVACQLASSGALARAAREVDRPRLSNQATWSDW